MSEETERIEILLRAKDKDLQRAIDRSNRLIAKFEKDAGRATTRSARNVETNLSRIGTSIKVFAGGALGTALVAAAGAAVGQTARVVKGIASIGDEARRSGLGVEEFQQLSFVATQSRIPIDALIDGMKELSLRADEFVVTGGGAGAEAFRRMGLNATDLKERLKDPSELMLEIIGRMEDMDRAAQIRVADEIFGGTGGERFVELLAQGDDGIRTLMARAQELGLVIDSATIAKAQELDRKFAEMQARVSTLAKRGIVGMADAINQALTIDVDDIFGDADRAIAMLGDENYRALKGSTALLDEQRDTVESLQTVYEDLFRAIRQQLGPDGIRLMDVADLDVAYDLAAIMDELMAAMDGFQNGTRGAEEFKTEVTDLVAEAEELLAGLNEVDAARFGGVIAAIGGISSALAAATAKASELAASLPAGDTAVSFETGPTTRPNNRPPSDLAPPTSPRPRLPGVNASFGTPATTRGGGGGGNSDLGAYRAEVEATRMAIAEFELEAASLLVAAEHGQELGDAMEYARKRTELLLKAQQDGQQITPELVAEVDALAMAYMEAALAAEQTEDRLDRLRDNAERGADAMGDLFLSVADGSKSAKDAVADLLMEIAKVQFQKAIIGLSGAGGFFGFLGGLLAPQANGGVFSGGRIQPFASGGVVNGPTVFPMAGGAAGLMGEAGPEAIMPLARGPGGKLGVRAHGGAGGGAGGSVDVRVFVDQDGNWQAAVEGISGAAARAEVRAATPQIVGSAVAQVGRVNRSTKRALGI